MGRLRNTLVLAAVVVAVVLVGVPAWAFTVTVTADPTTVAEPGGVVEYTVTVTGPCEGEPFCQVHNLRDGLGTTPCALPSPVFPAEGSFECTFNRTVTGTAGSTHTNVVQLSGFGCRDAGGLDCPAESIGLGSAEVMITESASSGDGGGRARSRCPFPDDLPSVREIERCTRILIRDQHQRQDVPSPRSTVIVVNTGSTDSQDVDMDDKSAPNVENIQSQVKALLD